MPEARQEGSAMDPAQLGNYYEAEVPDTLDLADHAGYGINHFTMSISEENDYEMYWGVQAMHYKPDLLALVGHEGKKKFGGVFGEYNPPIMDLQFSPLFACQAKCIEAMAMERLMSGSRQLLERETRMLDVFTSYLGDDGLHWVPADPNKPWLGPVEILPIAHTHGQGRMLRAMIIWYQYTGDPVWKERVDRMVNAFDTLFVVHKDDYAYVPIHGWRPEEYFRSCYTTRGWRDTSEPVDEKSGEEGSLFCHQAHLPGALANWHLLTGNEQALRLSGELSRFYTKPQFWSDWEGGEYPLVNGAEHAHWTGHYHGYINVLRAVLEYAIAANNARLKAFVRDGYEWSRHGEFATIGLVGDGQGCGCGRAIGLAVKLRGPNIKHQV